MDDDCSRARYRRSNPPRTLCPLGQRPRSRYISRTHVLTRGRAHLVRVGAASRGLLVGEKRVGDSDQSFGHNDHQGNEDQRAPTAIWVKLSPEKSPPISAEPVQLESTV